MNEQKCPIVGEDGKGSTQKTYPFRARAKERIAKEGQEGEVENWRPVVGYESQYLVSDLGRVWVKRMATKDGRTMRARFVKLQVFKTGYVHAHLYNGNQKSITVHRLVARAFLKNPKEFPCIHHKDGVKGNNAASNLEWCTYAQNAKYASEAGVLRRRPGILNYFAKLTDRDVLEIRKKCSEGWGQKEIAIAFGISSGTVGNIVTKRSWAHVV